MKRYQYIGYLAVCMAMMQDGAQAIKKGGSHKETISLVTHPSFDESLRDGDRSVAGIVITNDELKRVVGKKEKEAVEKGLQRALEYQPSGLPFVLTMERRGITVLMEVFSEHQYNKPQQNVKNPYRTFKLTFVTSNNIRYTLKGAAVRKKSRPVWVWRSRKPYALSAR